MTKNALTMSQAEIHQEALAVLNGMLQQNGIQGGISGIVQQVRGFETNPFLGGTVKGIVTQAAQKNSVTVQATPSQTLETALQGDLANHASAKLHESIQKVARANPSLAGNQLADAIAQDYVQTMNQDPLTQRYLGFANDIVCSVKSIPMAQLLQNVPPITTAMMLEPLKQQLSTMVPQTREVATAPEPAPKVAPKPEPTPEPAPQPAPKVAPKPEPAPQPEPKVAPKPEPAPQPAPKVAPKPEPTPQPAPKVAPKPEPTPQPAPKVAAAPEPVVPPSPTAVTVSNPPAAPTTNQPTTQQPPAPQPLNDANASNVLRTMRDSGFIGSEDEFNAVRTALDTGINRKYKTGAGNFFGDIGRFLMGIFTSIMNMFSGAGKGKDFGDVMGGGDGGYQTMSKTGEQMRYTLQTLKEMDPVRMGYKDTQSNVTGHDLVEAMTYRRAVVKAERDLAILTDPKHPKATRRTPSLNEIEEAQQRLSEADARFSTFDQSFKQRFGVDAETAFKRFEQRKEQLMNATAEQLGVEARANGLVDTPGRAELMQAFETNRAPASLSPDRLRGSITAERVKQEQGTKMPELSFTTSRLPVSDSSVTTPQTPPVQNGSPPELTFSR